MQRCYISDKMRWQGKDMPKAEVLGNNSLMLLLGSVARDLPAADCQT